MVQAGEITGYSNVRYGKPVAVLDFLQRQAGMDGRDAWLCAQNTLNKLPIGLKVGCDDLQDVVRITGDLMTRQDIGVATHNGLKIISRLIRVHLEADLNERRQVEAEADITAMPKGSLFNPVYA